MKVGELFLLKSGSYFIITNERDDDLVDVRFAGGSYDTTGMLYSILTLYTSGYTNIFIGLLDEE